LTAVDGCGKIASTTINLRGGAMNTLDPVTQHHVRQAAEALTDEFAGIYSHETIERFIAESLDLLGDARINVFVPVLAHRFARERLKALAQAEGKIVKDVPEVLFVCVQNAGRSQMAAALLHQRAPGLVHVRSPEATRRSR
jgi:arsenate reductase